MLGGYFAKLLENDNLFADLNNLALSGTNPAMSNLPTTNLSAAVTAAVESKPGTPLDDGPLTPGTPGNTHSECGSLNEKKEGDVSAPS